MKKHRTLRDVVVVDGRTMFADEYAKSLPWFNVFAQLNALPTDRGFFSGGAHSISAARRIALDVMQYPWDRYPYATITNRMGSIVEIVGPWEAWPVPRLHRDNDETFAFARVRVAERIETLTSEVFT